MKALEVLKDIYSINSGNKSSFVLTFRERMKLVKEAIKEIEVLIDENKSLVKTLEKYNTEMISLRKENQELKNRSCENCYEAKTCKILHSIYKDRLKNEGYAMHKNEFKCGFWHSLF